MSALGRKRTMINTSAAISARRTLGQSGPARVPGRISTKKYPSGAIGEVSKVLRLRRAEDSENVP